MKSLKQTILEKNEEINNDWLYSFNISIDATLDDYENGEDPNKTRNILKTKREIAAKNFKEALTKLLSDYLSDLYPAKYSDFYYVEDGRIEAQVNLTYDGKIPSKSEIEKWKKGEFKIFNNYCDIHVTKSSQGQIPILIDDFEDAGLKEA